MGGTLIVAGPDPFGGTRCIWPRAVPYAAAGWLVGRSCHDLTD